MRLLIPTMLEAYLRDDVILRLLNEHSRSGDETFTTQQWLHESAPKRCIYHELYGDLLDGSLTMNGLPSASEKPICSCVECRTASVAKRCSVHSYSAMSEARVRRQNMDAS